MLYTRWSTLGSSSFMKSGARSEPTCRHNNNDDNDDDNDDDDDDDHHTLQGHSHNTTTTTTQHNTTQHNTTQHNTTQHNTTQHNTTQHNTTRLPFGCHSTLPQRTSFSASRTKADLAVSDGSAAMASHRPQKSQKRNAAEDDGFTEAMAGRVDAAALAPPPPPPPPPRFSFACFFLAAGAGPAAAAASPSRSAFSTAAWSSADRSVKPDSCDVVVIFHALARRWA
jgi:hypothetical protein